MLHLVTFQAYVVAWFAREGMMVEYYRFRLVAAPASVDAHSTETVKKNTNSSLFYVLKRSDMLTANP